MNAAEAAGESGSSSLPDAVLRPVREGNAFESTVEVLGTAIRLGVFADVLAGDAERARRLSEEHCDATAALLRGLVG